MNHTIISLSSALVLASSVSTYALAATQDGEGVEEIKVTATRTPISADSATTAITIITKEELAKLQIFKISDYLKTVPGVALSSSGSVGGAMQLRMRGAEANQTLVLIDGVEMNDPAAGDEFQFEHLTSNEIERIEIIRAPMSAAWGSDALSGVINIITRKADKPFEASAFAEYGSLDTYRAGARLGISRDKWNLTAGYSRMKSDGSNVSRTGSERDGYVNNSFNMRFSVDLSDTLAFSASLRNDNAETAFDGTDWLTGLPADSDNVSKTEKTAISAGLRNTALDGRLVSRLRATWLDTEIENFAFGADNGTTGAEKQSFYFDNSFTIDARNAVTAAIDYEKTDFVQTGAASPWGDPNQMQSVTNTGYLVDYVGGLTDAITVAGSLRHDANSDFDDITSWHVGASVKVADTTRIFMSASKAQKAPTFLERYGFFADQFLGNPNVKPERSRGYEIGIAHAIETRGADVELTATYFNTDLKDEIDGFAFDPTTFLFTAVNKTSDSKRSGFELTADGALTDMVRFNASYTYIDATEDDGTGTQVNELRRPKHAASLSLFMEVTDSFNISTNLNYTGKAVDLFFPPWPMPSERVTLKAYTLLRVAADYSVTDEITLYGRVENAFNEVYENVYGFATPQRTAYVGLRANF